MISLRYNAAKQPAPSLY